MTVKGEERGHVKDECRNRDKQLSEGLHHLPMQGHQSTTRLRGITGSSIFEVTFEMSVGRQSGGGYTHQG